MIVDQPYGGMQLRHELFGEDDGNPTILLFPTVMGVSDLERGFADRLAGRGYRALVADLYGARFTAEERPQARAAMDALRGDRAGLRDLLSAILEKVRALAGVDSAKVAAIGFCFGGQCALDLARSGAELAGVVSFHGLLDPPGLPEQPIRAKVAAYHGWDDPLATPDAVVALGKELTEAGADWQLHAYGHVGHGFTNPGATGVIPGVKFDERTSRRAWQACDLFLAECFGAASND